MKRLAYSLILATSAAGMVTGHAQGVGDTAVDFNRDILPILSNNCFACHGPDDNARKADLRLDIRDGAIAPRKNGLAISPGRPGESLLLARITAHDDDRMPPAETGDTLSPREIELLERWIEQGAGWSDHWSFSRPERPPLPEVQHGEWVRNPIDRFVLARMEAVNLDPSPESDRRTLIRRVSLDLIGLPPTTEEVEAFVHDQAPDAYERLVDRLLASPHFGEQQALAWLDIARYADSQGFEKDRPRIMWRYRDWVINAINADMPFDQFTREQLAGDLLESPTIDQQIATGFHRNTQTNTEGGTDNEEFRSAAVIDRVNTTMQAWMGLTAGCAQCHTHKFDPIQHEEYFGLYAFFNQTEDADLDDDSPFIQAPTAMQRSELERLQQAAADLDKRLSPPDEEVQAAVTMWVNAQERTTPWTTLEANRMETESGATLTADDAGVIHAGGDVPLTDTYTLDLHADLPRLTALQLEVIEGDDGRGPGRTGHGNFVVNEIEIRSTSEGALPVSFADAEATFQQVDYPVAEAIDGDATTLSGWAIAPVYDQDQVAVFRFNEPLELAEDELVRVTIRQTHGTQHVLEHFRLSGTDHPRASLPLPEQVETILAIPADERDAEQEEVLARHVLKHEPTLDSLRTALETANSKRDEYDKGIPNALVMRELGSDMQRTTHLFLGGSFLTPDVERGPIDPIVPAFLHQFPDDAPRTRQGLADWLVHRDNPLTARVQVNRAWSRCFGSGLVSTEGDFGVQGARPSHPALLDWLAVYWQDDLQWSHKELLRLLVTSATYRQASVVTTKAIELDPENRLLSRASRLRNGAEQIRDQALFASGLLKLDRIGGPSVTPYLPKGMLPQAFDNYIQPVSTGDDLHRRSVYTDWRRTGHYPAFATFDAPSREFCTINRQRSNTPLQALVLLNDAVFIEAAQAMARRSMIDGGDDINARLDILFGHALSRPPSREERVILQTLYVDALDRFQGDATAAEQLATDPCGPLPEGLDMNEAAAMTTVSNVVLNLDEFVNRP